VKLKLYSDWLICTEVFFACMKQTGFDWYWFSKVYEYRKW